MSPWTALMNAFSPSRPTPNSAMHFRPSSGRDPARNAVRRLLHPTAVFPLRAHAVFVAIPTEVTTTNCRCTLPTAINIPTYHIQMTTYDEIPHPIHPLIIILRRRATHKASNHHQKGAHPKPRVLNRLTFPSSL